MRAFRYAPTAAGGESLAPLILAKMLGAAIITRSLPADSGRVAGVAIKLAQISRDFTTNFEWICNTKAKANGNSKFFPIHECHTPSPQIKAADNNSFGDENDRVVTSQFTWEW